MKKNYSSFSEFAKGVVEADKNQTVEDGYLIPEVWEVCENWWEEFKMCWFPPLLKKFWPVKYRKIKVREELLKLAKQSIRR